MKRAPREMRLPSVRPGPGRLETVESVPDRVEMGYGEEAVDKV